jgi:nitrogen fixation/metabolism regulation signal transduction histidine kinase
VAPKGALLLTVPAHPTLWSYFDEASRHVRRYTAAELESRIVRAGFAVEYLTLYMASIFPLIWLKRRLTSLVARPAGAPANRIDNLAAGELRITPVLNGLLSFLLNQESRLIARRRRLPIGASLLAVARRE